jgi:hypothetical protein
MNLQQIARLGRRGGGPAGGATAVTFAGILPFASLVARLATALALAGILAFAGVLSGVVQVDCLVTGGDQLAAGLGSRGARRSHRTAGGTGEKTAERGGGDCQFLIGIHDHVPFSFVIGVEFQNIRLTTENKSVNHQRPGWPGDEKTWPVHPSASPPFPESA